MTPQSNTNLMLRYLEASTSEDTAAFKELLAPDFVAHVPGGPKNRDGFLEHNSYFNQAFSERRLVVEDLVAEGDKVVARVTWNGVHSGGFRGLPPTGKRISISAYIVERFEQGRSVEHWSLFDQMSMMQQLGLIPPS